ncbi:MAG: hypothetical protein QNJ54_35020 [Prochloraceae cyanobacterium]|nr:hypothetical protein [Prochloraceae cyanobacterium]
MGKEVKVAWWGQVKKEDGDIDEIPQKRLEDIKFETRSRLILAVRISRNWHILDLSVFIKK